MAKLHPTQTHQSLTRTKNELAETPTLQELDCFS